MYVGYADTEDEAIGGFWGAFGGHFGSIWRTFWAHFGGPKRTWKKILHKGGGVLFLSHRFLLKNEKIKIWGIEKASKIGPKMGPKNVAKKVTSKSVICTFLESNCTKILYFTIENVRRGPILLYFKLNSRVRKGRKITAHVAKTLEKHCFFVFFLVLAWKMLCVDFGRSKAPNLGPKSGPGTMKIGSEKRGL